MDLSLILPMRARPIWMPKSCAFTPKSPASPLLHIHPAILLDWNPCSKPMPAPSPNSSASSKSAAVSSEHAPSRKEVVPHVFLNQFPLKIISGRNLGEGITGSFPPWNKAFLSQARLRNMPIPDNSPIHHSQYASANIFIFSSMRPPPQRNGDAVNMSLHPPRTISPR
jgi:hypothetical protein